MKTTSYVISQLSAELFTYDFQSINNNAANNWLIVDEKPINKDFNWLKEGEKGINLLRIKKERGYELTFNPITQEWLLYSKAPKGYKLVFSKEYQGYVHKDNTGNPYYKEISVKSFVIQHY